MRGGARDLLSRQWRLGPARLYPSAPAGGGCEDDEERSRHGVGERHGKDRKEKEMRVSADFVLYTITPKMTGVYSIAEAVEDSNKRPATTVFVYLEEDEGAKFDAHQMKALKNTAKLIAANGGIVASSLQEVADILNAA